MQLGNHQSADPGNRGGDSEQKNARYLYIVSKGGDARSEQIFAEMRRDMANAAVELMYDRRSGERRRDPLASETNQERRAGDRRQQDVTPEIANIGWARVRLG